MAESTDSSIIGQCLEEHAALKDLLNPPDLAHSAGSVFTEDVRAQALLKEFTIYTFTYYTLPAARITPELRAAALAAGFDTSTELKVHIAIPTTILNSPEPTCILWVRLHGGGGVSATGQKRQH